MAPLRAAQAGRGQAALANQGKIGVAHAEKPNEPGVSSGLDERADHGAAVSIQHGQQFAFLEFSLALVERLGECFVPVPVQNEGKKELMVEGREQARIGAERIRETVPAYLAEFPGVAMRGEGLEGVGVRGDGVTNLADLLRNEDALFRRVVPMSASIQADEDQVDGGGEIGHQSMETGFGKSGQSAVGSGQ